MRLAAGIILLLFIAACAHTPSGNVVQEQQTVTIGVSAPLTGEAASFGKGMRAGVMLAVDEINAKGGVNGKQLAVIFEDDKCNAQGGATTIAKLVQVDKVDVIIGPVCSGASGAGLPVAEEGKTPAIIAASAPHLTKIGDYAFRLYPSDSFVGTFVAKYVKNDLHANTVAVVYTKNDWGQGIHDSFIEAYEAIDGKILVDEGVNPEMRDFRTIVLKLQERRPDVIVIPLYPANGLAFVEQLREAGITSPIIGGDALDATEFKGNAATNGVMVVTAVIGSTKEFENRAKAYTDDPTNLVVPIGYDAVKLIEAAVQLVDSGDAQSLRDALASSSYEGISNALIEFDEQGDLKASSYNVKVVDDGETRILS